MDISSLRACVSSLRRRFPEEDFSSFEWEEGLNLEASRPLDVAFGLLEDPRWELRALFYLFWQVRMVISTLYQLLLAFLSLVVVSAPRCNQTTRFLAG